MPHFEQHASLRFRPCQAGRDAGRLRTVEASSDTSEVPSGERSESLLAAPLRTRGEQIADRLVTAIALGEYVPGQRLPTERELAATLDASRRSVREALHRLAEEHYIEILRGRSGGAFVRSSWGQLSPSMVSRTLLPTWEQLEDVLELRRAVEPMIARKAAERRSDRDLVSIRAAIEAYRAAEGREASRQADLDVHNAIAVAARN